jgi:hypothetical protein
MTPEAFPDAAELAQRVAALSQDAIDDYLIRHDSFVRWGGIVEIFNPKGHHADILAADPARAGRAFWYTVSWALPACDGIAHWQADALFHHYRDHWDPDVMEPEVGEATRRATKKGQGRLQVYRGASGNDGNGVCWTTDITRAIYFARGGRFGTPLHPTVYTMRIHRGDIAMAIPTRGESEIVIFDHALMELHYAVPAPALAAACGLKWGHVRASDAPATRKQQQEYHQAFERLWLAEAEAEAA